MLFSGLRNISLQILRIVGRVWNEGSRILCQWLPSPSSTTKRLVLQNLPSLVLPALIRSHPTRAFPFSLRTTSNTNFSHSFQCKGGIPEVIPIGVSAHSRMSILMSEEDRSTLGARLRSTENSSPHTTSGPRVEPWLQRWKAQLITAKPP